MRGKSMNMRCRIDVMRFAVIVCCAAAFSLSGCRTTVPAEPPWAERLLRSASCNAHIVESYRALESRRLAGVVVVREDETAYFSGARVIVRRKDDARIYETTTDAHGRFAFDELPNGTYEFLACAEGMDPDQGWVVVRWNAKPRELWLSLRFGV